MKRLGLTYLVEMTFTSRDPLKAARIADAYANHYLTQQLQTGMLWINQPSPAWPEMPFGGVKDSGYGSEGGPEALEAYLNTKSVSTLNL